MSVFATLHPRRHLAVLYTRFAYSLFPSPQAMVPVLMLMPS